MHDRDYTLSPLWCLDYFSIIYFLITNTYITSFSIILPINKILYSIIYTLPVLCITLITVII